MQDLAQFKQQLKPYKAIIGFDYGSKRLGIAVSDLLLTVATPYAIWRRSDFAKDLAYIQILCYQHSLSLHFHHIHAYDY